MDATVDAVFGDEDVAAIVARDAMWRRDHTRAPFVRLRFVRSNFLSHRVCAERGGYLAGLVEDRHPAFDFPDHSIVTMNDDRRGHQQVLGDDPEEFPIEREVDD